MASMALNSGIAVAKATKTALSSKMSSSSIFQPARPSSLSLKNRVHPAVRAQQGSEIAAATTVEVEAGIDALNIAEDVTQV